MIKIDKFSVSNFKSFKTFNLKDIKELTVLIGSNGSGKSNLLSMINFIPNLLKYGGANYLRSREKVIKDYLHSWDEDNVIKFVFSFINLELLGESIGNLVSTSKAEEVYEYTVEIKWCEKESLHISQEKLVNLTKNIIYDYSQLIPLARGSSYHSNLILPTKIEDSLEAKLVYNFLINVRSYSFYNNNFFFSKITPFNKELNNLNNPDKIQTATAVNNYGYDVGTLLWRIKENYIHDYHKIVQIIKIMIPSFQEFVLIMKDEGVGISCKMHFSPKIISLKFLSDGTMRFIVLTCLLNSPKKMRPAILLLEEPEISLHPYAIELLGDLIDSYTQESQIVLATHSPALLNKVKKNSIYTLQMDNESGESSIKPINIILLKNWLEQYQIGELWRMNLLGGNPIS
ncbi:AAA family ATPase [Candidatus Hepatincolaceae symbiont of Richtersius coronifer]